MKTLNYTVQILIIILLLCVNSAGIAQVGIGTTNPDASAMLDIQSTSKGILVPRMDSSQRSLISNPANGLLVFDTTSESFWFYNSSWVELISNNTLLDTDGDTGIKVEQTADEDKIRMSTAGSERITIDNVGNTRIGDGTNNTYIEVDGSLSYEGTATRYDDLRIPVTSTTKNGTKDPTMDMLIQNGTSQGVFLQFFDDSVEEELYFIVQMPHNWKEGSDIYPHVHWTSTNDVGTNKVVWGLEYTWANVASPFTTPTIIIGKDPIGTVGSVSAYEHAITPLSAITASGKYLSSVLLCRIFRDATNPDDTFDDLIDPYDAVGLIEIDFHYQVDSDGSRQEYTK